MINDKELRGAGFGDMDRHFAAFMERLSGGSNPELRLAAALVSRKRGEGDICLDLGALAGTSYPSGDDKLEPIQCPDLDVWMKQLKRGPVVGGREDVTPLVLEGSRLYLRRYWEYEKDLTRRIVERARAGTELDWELARPGLERFFPAAKGGVNFQRVAAYAAVRKKFCVLSGGPGTGKTRTVVLLLALLIELAGTRGLRIAIAAPTGKAAARLQDSIKNAKASLDCEEWVKARLPEEAATIHRLLRVIPESPYFFHNAANPLAVDVLVVDEASMVDLALMAKLFEALPAEARVILLGDKDQLASVEAGAVLGDICGGGAINSFSRSFGEGYLKLTGEALETSPARENELRDCIVQLRKNYRFGEESGIYRLSEAVNRGEVNAALDVLRGAGATGVRWRKLPSAGTLKRGLAEKVMAGFKGCFEAVDAVEALRELNRFRILCAVRHGPYGVAGVNAAVEEILEEEGLIRRAGRWYPGRPLMITRNDYNLKLFNGDVGLVQRDEQSGELRACFLDAEQGVRKFPPLRLPEHETVYAMTVHKSQGSEFERVLFILPERESPVLTRELVYTGLTRSSREVEIWGEEAVLRAAVGRPVRRASGLREGLWGSCEI